MGGLAVFVASLAWDQLFLVYDVLPATIPPALVLLGCELRTVWLRRSPPAPVVVRNAPR